MITINLKKAKDIAHEKRRVARAQEFAPLDIKATIPAESAKAEAERQKVRDKYAVMQSQIDAVNSVDGLKAVITTIL